MIENCIEFVRDKTLENIIDPVWTDIQFKNKKTFDERRRNAQAVLKKYPDRVPIICERANRYAPKLDRNKYLVPKDISMGDFMFIIRKRMNLSPEKSIYMFVGSESLAPVSHTMGMIYDNHKDNDQFLYIRYSSESTFG